MEAVRSYGLLLRWQLLRMRQQLVMLIVIQVALAMGIVYGMSFLLPRIDPQSALFLATGAPTVTLLILGLNVVPQEVSQGKLTGRTAYINSLPVPRLAPPAADVTFWLLAQLPGTLLALVVASLRFHFALHLNAAVVPAIVLVALTGAAVGYGLAMALRPEIAQQAGSFVAILILLFSPINFPADRLPRTLQLIHDLLPIQYMADLVRWSLTGVRDGSLAVSFAVVAAWCLGGIAMSWRIATRRQ